MIYFLLRTSQWKNFNWRYLSGDIESYYDCSQGNKDVDSTTISGVCC